MKIELCISTMTPLWTGDAGRNCNRLHETGLIGSLRWWFEVVLRGLGFYICDPTQKSGGGDGRGACTFDIEKYTKIRSKGEEMFAAARAAGLCPACRVFGATGWRKALQLKVEDSGLEPVMNASWGSFLLPSGRRHNNRAGGWYLLPGLCGRFSLTLGFRSPLVQDDLQGFDRLLLAIFMFAEFWTAIGAKETSGCGVFKIDNKTGLASDVIAIRPLLQGCSLKGTSAESLPSLDKFFFAKIRFETKENEWWRRFKEVELAMEYDSSHGGKGEQTVEGRFKQWIGRRVFPLSPIFRNWLRYTWYDKLNNSKPRENLIFGTAGSNRQRTAIGISHAYLLKDNLWEVRLWGFCPPRLKKGDWGEFLNMLCQAIEFSKTTLSVWDSPNWKQKNTGWHNEGGLWGGIAAPAEFVWREFNSNRDTVGVFSDPLEFFGSLVQGREKGNG